VGIIKSISSSPNYLNATKLTKSSNPTLTNVSANSSLDIININGKGRIAMIFVKTYTNYSSLPTIKIILDGVEFYSKLINYNQSMVGFLPLFPAYTTAGNTIFNSVYLGNTSPNWQDDLALPLTIPIPFKNNCFIRIIGGTVSSSISICYELDVI
jgi:hypothetical protein